MKRDTAIILGAGALALGDGFQGAKNFMKSADRLDYLGQYAQVHPIATGVLAYVGYKVAWPMIRKAL